MMVYKHRFLLIAAGLLLQVIFFVQGYAQSPKTIKTKKGDLASVLKMWDNKPATDWMTEAYPIGNGRIGAMIFGGVNEEHLQFNHNSLWTGDENDRGTYQAFGDLFVDFENKGGNKSEVKDYRRELDMRRSIQQVSYRKDNLSYKREYFCSFPDKVIVARFTAAKKGAYAGTIRLKDVHGSKVTAVGNTLFFSGKLLNGMAYQASAVVKNEGGLSSIEPDGEGGYRLRIKDADAITILLTAATDFVNQRSAHWKGEAPAMQIEKLLKTARNKTFTSLLNAHQKDYSYLFARMNLNLGISADSTIQQPTFKRLLNYKKTADRQLEELIFQYGRYLLISSSRKGGLPANLQGLWNNTNNPPWGGDYHSNINIQMNYWPAEPANLSECHFPYLDYINSIREVKKEHTQKEFGKVRGWTVRTENNIFGGESYNWNTPGSAWFVQALWEHYAFTKDIKFLRTFAYPIIKEICEFWDDHLKRREDGTLVAPMGWSPEHGPTEDGVTHDQQIIYDLFTNYIEAADDLSIDKSYRDRIAVMKAHLLKPKIGKWGQLQEWETDRDDPKDTHRHVSHLFGLYPGREISPITTPELAAAAKVSLLARGNESTGWSMAWKMNFWARLLDGEHAYKILRNFITPVGGGGIDYNNGGGIYSNLFCAHPPFQIDGNLGYTAGVAEMLVQSQTGEIQLLPAVPAAWGSGRVQGLKARGNFELKNLQWKNGKVETVTIQSMSGGVCRVRSSNALKPTIRAIKTEQHGNYFTYSFSTKPGETYTFNAVGNY